MASQESIFPLRDDVERDPAGKTLPLADAGDIIGALTSQTARTLVAEVYEDPATASELATTADTSLQNAQYHLTRLQDVGLVEVVDTWYSSRGKAMAVYGPTNDPLVIVAGADVADAEPSAVNDPDDPPEEPTDDPPVPQLVSD
ncbi:ArsR/SmtB family transcription factor [Halosegnis sp.]|uniref:ArsR/SmtB family transcription factor n=1 Tax=Halosegnis sp. TaxID=2864959 RepID=UPI0035D3DBEB